VVDLLRKSLVIFMDNNTMETSQNKPKSSFGLVVLVIVAAVLIVTAAYIILANKQPKLMSFQIITAKGTYGFSYPSDWSYVDGASAKTLTRDNCKVSFFNSVSDANLGPDFYRVNQSSSNPVVVNGLLAKEFNFQNEKDGNISVIRTALTNNAFIVQMEYSKTDESCKTAYYEILQSFEPSNLNIDKRPGRLTIETSTPGKTFSFSLPEGWMLGMSKDEPVLEKDQCTITLNHEGSSEGSGSAFVELSSEQISLDNQTAKQTIWQVANDENMHQINTYLNETRIHFGLYYPESATSCFDDYLQIIKSVE